MVPAGRLDLVSQPELPYQNVTSSAAGPATADRSTVTRRLLAG
jgi:hypothetical protein